MHRYLRVWSLLAVLAATINWATHSQAQPVPIARSMITEAVDAKHLIVLGGNTRPEATERNDLGRVSDGFEMQRMFLLLRRPPERQRAFSHRIEQLTDPKSDQFHRWLTAQEIGDRYGPSSHDVQVVSAWLSLQGFHINRIYKNRLVIDFSGTAGKIRKAFHTEIHSYAAHGHHFANASDPQIPAALAPAIVGVVSLNDFPLSPEYTFVSKDKCLDGTCYAVVPTDLWKIYNFTPLFEQGVTGRGQTVAVVEDSNLFQDGDDVTKFRSALGLANYAGTFETVHPENCWDPGLGEHASEATLDVEWAGAAAPDAKILLASCKTIGAFTNGILTALVNLVDWAEPPPIISISYGVCESTAGVTLNQAIETALSQAAAENISVYVGAGDNGAATCDLPAPPTAHHGIGVNAYASTPFAVAVGGTDFGDTFQKKNRKYWSEPADVPPYGSALSYVPEIPWNSSCASTLIAKFVSGSKKERTYGLNGFCNTFNNYTNVNYLNISAGGGGPSSCVYKDQNRNCVGGWPKPYGQAGIAGNPNDGVRDLPDVSLFSAVWAWDHAFVYCYSNLDDHGASCSGQPSTWSLGGGTSFAAPIWAGIQALVNQALNAPQGDPLPFLYGRALSTFQDNEFCYSQKIQGRPSGCMFYDITEGDTDVDCAPSWLLLIFEAKNCYRPDAPAAKYGVLSTSNSSYQPAYRATPTWDFATGIGTPNVANLVNAWAANWIIYDEWVQGFGSGYSYDVVIFNGTQVFVSDIWSLDRLVSVNGRTLNGSHLAGGDNGVERTWRDLAGAIPGDGTYFVYSNHDAGGGNDGDISIIFLSVQKGVWTYSSYLPSNFPR